MESKVNFNIAQQQIADMNMEITLFLGKFQKFQDLKIADKNLFQNLELIYKKIEKFIDNDPELINTIDNRTDFTINLKEQYINRIFICEKCNYDIGERSKDVLKHINFHPQHGDIIKESILKEQNNNVKRNNKLAIQKDNRQVLKEHNKIKKNKLTELMDSRKLPKKAKQFFLSDLNKYFKESIDVAVKMKILPEYIAIEKSIINTIKKTYPDVKIHLFGSRISGLGGYDSDLDIFVEIGNAYNASPDNHVDVLKKLRTVTNLLSKSSDWKNFFTVPSARVPILRVLNIKEKIDCDIGFSNGLGPRNTYLMKYFFELQPVCQKMCIFIKKWLKVTTLNNHFSTYTLVLMVVFYLQTVNLLPSVKELQKDIKKPLFEIGPWQGDFIQKSLKELNMILVSNTNSTCIYYIIEFFNFYGNDFKFDTSIICPYLGTIIQKHSLNNLIDLIPRYVNFFKINPTENKFQLERPLCVQDPLELNHNVAKGISPGILQLLHHYFNETSAELSLLII